MNWELHSAAGFWTVGLLSIWALSGFYFGYSAQVIDWVNRFSPLSQVEAPVSKLTGSKEFRAVDELVSKSRQLAPHNYFYGVQMPAGKQGVYIVFMARVDHVEKRECDYLYFNQHSGDYLKTWRRGVNASLGDAVISAMVPLHFGSFGGVWVKALWCLLGLTPALMLVTGAIMWWRRTLRRRYQRSTSIVYETKPAA